MNRLTSTRSLPGMVNQDGVSDEEIITTKSSSKLSSSTPDILEPLEAEDGSGATEKGEARDTEEEIQEKDNTDGTALDDDKLGPPFRAEQEHSGSLTPDEV